MEFSVALIVIGLVLIVLGSLVQIVRAFQTSIPWGVAYLVIPGASLVFIVCHWARAKGSLVCMLIGFAVMALGAFSDDKSARELWAALRSSDDVEDVETLSASIEEQRLRIETLENQFQARGAELAKQFEILDKRRKELKGTDADEVQRFNIEAESYTASNSAHKTLGAELESARKQLTGLLDERARLRAANPSAQNAEPARGANPAATAPTAKANGKRIVMYTTASCPACVAAKS